LFAIARGGGLRVVDGLWLYSFEMERRAHDSITITIRVIADPHERLKLKKRD
jgi:hypothetical protein